MHTLIAEFETYKPAIIPRHTTLEFCLTGHFFLLLQIRPAASQKSELTITAEMRLLLTLYCQLWCIAYDSVLKLLFALLFILPKPNIERSALI